MGHYGVLVPAYTGHLNPLLALARALERRGHRVTVLSALDAEAKVRRAGLEFQPIAQVEFPLGEWPRATARAGELTGVRATWAATHVVARFARGIQRELSEIVARERLDGLVMDQIAVGTEGVCQVMKLPLAVACGAMAFQIESRVPPWSVAWAYRPALPFRLRNIAAQFCSNMVGMPLLAEVGPYRFKHRLPMMTYHYINELAPSLVQVAQQPAFFDFPRRHLPDNFHSTGPWVDADARADSAFPWARLDGRPVVYASLGTLQNRLEPIFRAIIAACATLDVQLVVALGREGATLSGAMPANVFVVDYAPQLALIQRADVVITHAGLNTVLECLRAGVPMVALPITNDQPGVAARVRALGVGEFVTIGNVTPERLRETIQRVRAEPAHRARARQCAAELATRDGASGAAELIEIAFTSRQRVRRKHLATAPASAPARTAL
jgi:zeaxanthin glucosyltransferase